MDFLPCRPDIPQEDFGSIRPGSERILLEINVHCSSNGIGDHKKGTSQVVSSCIGMNASLEVPVAGQNSSTHQTILLDDINQIILQRTRISNAGHTAVPHYIESESFQSRNHSRFPVKNQKKFQ